MEGIDNDEDVVEIVVVVVVFVLEIVVGALEGHWQSEKKSYFWGVEKVDFLLFLFLFLGGKEGNIGVV